MRLEPQRQGDRLMNSGRRLRALQALLAILTLAVFRAITAAASSAAPASPVSGKSNLIAEISAVCRTEAGDDDAALGRLIHKMDEPMAKAMSFQAIHRHDLIAAIADRANPWCVRYFSGVGLSQSQSLEIVDPLLTVLTNKNEAPRVRAGAAMGLQSVVGKSPKAKDALTQVLYEPNVAPPLVDDVMKVLGQVGVSDIDLMLKIMDSPARNINALGTNFNAIRALGASGDPKGLEVLLKLLDKYPSGSLMRGVVLDEFENLAKAKDGPKRLTPVRERLVQKLIVMSREDEAAARHDVNDEHGPELNDSVILMGLLEDSSTVDRLIELLNDPNQDTLIVSQAAKALGRIGDKRALPHLEKLWGRLPTDPRDEGAFARGYEYYRRTGKTDGKLKAIKDALDKLSK